MDFSILKSFFNFDKFLKMQILLGFFYSITWCLFIPIVDKERGRLVSVTAIAVYLVLSRISGLMIPFLKGKSLKTWVFLLLVNTILYVIAAPFYFIDKIVFLYLEMAICITSGILYPLVSISWDLYIVDRYSMNVYEDYRYIDQFKSSLGGIIGYSFIIFLSKICEMDTIVVIFIVLLNLCLAYEIYNFKVNYYKKDFTIKTRQK
jgi:hypothetical protein